MNGYVDSFRKYRGLLWELVKKGIKLKYRRSYLGIIWTLLEPILTTMVLVFVFQNLFGRDSVNGVPFTMYILSGRLLYSCFSGGTNVALRSIRANSGMIKKVYVPKYLYPVAGILHNFIIFGISLIVLVLGMIIFRIKVTWHIFEAIIPLTLLFLLVLGVGMILSTIAVFFRDMEYLWSVVLMLIMYASAIFYYPDVILESGVSFILKFNPLFCVISNFRSCLFGQELDTWMLGYSAIFAVISVVVGYAFFEKNKNKFILHL